MDYKTFFCLLTNQLTRLTSLFKRRDWPRILVISVILGLVLTLMAGVLFFSYATFSFFSQFQSFKEPVIIYSLAVTLILTFTLTFASSLITALGTLFQRDDNLLVFSLPVKTQSLFELRLLDTVFLSSWPLFVFASPVILGYGLALKLSPLNILLFLMITLFLTLLATLSGVLLATIITWLGGNLKNKTTAILGIMAVPLLGWGLIRLLLPPQLVQNLGKLEIDQINRLVNRQAILHPWLPTTWAVRFVQLWPVYPRLGAGYWYLLVGVYILILVALLLVMGRFYRQAVDKAGVGRFIAAPWDTVVKKARPFPYLLKGKIGALTEKDWLLVLRSPPQLFQLGFIIFLQLIYFLIVNRIPAYRFEQVFPNGSPDQLAWVNFLFVNFLAAVVGMRFFFPMISLEGHSSWVIWSAPVKRMRVFWQKFAAAFSVILAWMTLSTTFSTISLGLPLTQFRGLFLLNLPLGITLVMITLGVGAIKPNFWEKNPEKLSTSPGGILATTICLGYIGLVSAVFFFFKNSYPEIIGQLLVWGVSALVCLLIFWQIPKAITRYEV